MIISEWPEANHVEDKIIAMGITASGMISDIRNIKNELGNKLKEKLSIGIETTDIDLYKPIHNLIIKSGSLSEINYYPPEEYQNYILSGTTKINEYKHRYIINHERDKEDERKRLEMEV